MKKVYQDLIIINLYKDKTFFFVALVFLGPLFCSLNQTRIETFRQLLYDRLLARLSQAMVILFS